MFFNLRLALRRVLKSPGYSAACVLIVALAIAANSALFSVVYAVILRPTTMNNVEDLVVVWHTNPEQGIPVVELTYRAFEYWAANSKSFVQVSAMGSSTWPTVLEGRAEPARLAVSGVSAGFFDTLGAVPLLGRTFRAEDDVKNAARVAVLSHGTWVRRFGGVPSTIGETIILDREPHTVVGVMPADFDFPARADVWTPVVPILAENSTPQLDALSAVGVLFVVARLREGVTPTMAEEELHAVNEERRRLGLARRGGAKPAVTRFVDYTVGPVRHVLWVLLSAAGVLLLVGCTNVSNMMVTRESTRLRENAVRLALGGTPQSIRRLWLTETLMIALSGGALGLLMSNWVAQAIVALAPAGVPRLGEVSVNLPVVVFTLGAIILVALASGLGAERSAVVSGLVDALNSGSRAIIGRPEERRRWWLAVFQVGMAVLLLIASGLVLRSFLNLRSLELGFTPAGVLTMELDPQIESQDPTWPVGKNEWFQELILKVVALPGVQAAGAIYLRPLSHGPVGQEIWVLLEGQPDTPEARRENPQLSYQVATPDYFAAMRIPLKSGRLFTPHDNVRAPRVAIVSESTARLLWPGQDAVGRRFLTTSFLPEPATTWRTVVGVVGDVRYRGLDDLRLDVYDAALQAHDTAGDLVVRTTGNPLALSAAVQREARSLNPRVVINGVTTMESIVAQAIAPWRLSAWMFSLFAGAVFVLSAFGLFSIVSFDVAHRRREFAVRLAMGATPGVILRSVLVEAGGRILAGVALGIMASVASSRVIRSLLFEVPVVDPATYAIVSAVVCLVVGGAAYLPALRAVRLSPTSLLRSD